MTKELQQETLLYQDILSHDITNYLLAAAMAIELAEIDKTTPSEVEQVLAKARQSVERASRLVKNVRLIGATDDSQTLEQVDIVECIKRSYHQVCAALNVSDCEFSIDMDYEECFTKANRLLDDVFLNLIRNAITYSPNKKKIEVEIKLRADCYWEILMNDYGRGIASTKREMIFERYSKGADGSGLGLSVVKSLVGIYGGEISVEDRVPGDYTLGTSFVILLPSASE